jgi:hypothetical protein
VVADEESIEEQAEEAVEEGQEHDPASSQASVAPPDRLPIGLSAPHTRDPAIIAAVWLTGVMKVGGAILALALAQPWGRRSAGRERPGRAGCGGLEAFALAPLRVGHVLPDLGCSLRPRHLATHAGRFIVPSILVASELVTCRRGPARRGVQPGALL